MTPTVPRDGPSSVLVASATWPTRVVPPAWKIAAGFAAVFGLYLAWQLQPAHLLTFVYSYDEGVYAQTGWAVLRGYRLFEEVFSSQPPLMPLLLAGTFALAGPSAAAGRAVAVAFSLGALLGVALLATRARGWSAGLGAAGLLALSYDFIRTGHSISPEGPALAFATLSVAFAALYANNRRPLWCLAASVALTVGTLLKLSSLTSVVPLAILVAAAHRGQPSLKAIGRDLTFLVLPPVLAWGLVLWLYDPAQVFDQLVIYHVQAKEAFPLDLALNVSRLRKFVMRNPLVWILATLGLATLRTSRQRVLLLAALAWLSATVGALVTHSPLIEHHLVVALPPAAVFGGVGLTESIRAVRRFGRRRNSGRVHLTSFLALGALAVALIALAQTLVFDYRSLPDLEQDWQEPSAALAALSGATDSRATVVTDEPMLALAAGRAVPPSLVDTSNVRMQTGYLTSLELQDVVEEDRPAAVLFWSGRFDDNLPGFRPWVRRLLRLERSFGSGRELYVQR